MATCDEWIDDELDRHFEPASAAGRRAAEREPRACAARYDAAADRVVVELTNGCVFAFPPALAQGLEHATAEQLAEVEVVGRGAALHWETLDADLSVPALLVGVFGTRAWMREVARRVGASTSPAKAQAARENGRKGGRPRKRADTP